MLPGSDLSKIAQMMPVPRMHFLSGFVGQSGPVCIVKEARNKIISDQFSWEFRACCHCLQGIPINMVYLKIVEWNTLYSYPVDPFSTPTLRVLSSLETHSKLEFLVFDETGNSAFECEIENPLHDLKVHCLRSVESISSWDERGFTTAVLLLEQELSLQDRWNMAGESLRDMN